MRIALIPCGETDWGAEGRLLGRVELPLSEAGEARCAAWARELEPLGLERIVHGPDELGKRTATLLAAQLRVPTRALEGLHEVDTGLWSGLTECELKRRYATAHRELKEAPLNVQPPGGEALRSAAKRLAECLDRQIRRNGVVSLGVVARPFALALASCALRNGPTSEVWELAWRVANPIVIECAQQPRIVSS
jgi:probable phosphoglycerate mutase